MPAFLGLLCVAAGLLIYFVVVRPFVIPLEWKVPTSRVYLPTIGTRLR